MMSSETKKDELICTIVVGRDGNEWVAVITYSNGKVTEFRDAVFEEVAFAVAREVEGVE